MTRKRDYRPPFSMSRNVARAVHAAAWEKDLQTRAKKKAAPGGRTPRTATEK